MFIIKAMSKSELAAAYGVSVRTFRKWVLAMKADLRKQIPLTREILKPALVRDIVKHLGEPE